MTLTEDQKKKNQNRKGGPQKSSKLNNAKRNNIMGTSKFANERIYKQNKSEKTWMYVYIIFVELE